MSKAKTEYLRLNWGDITVDLFNDKKGEVVHVFNFSMLTDQQREFVRKFVVGKVIWFVRYTESEYDHIIDVDIRGQEEIEFEFDLMNNWRDKVLEEIGEKCPNIMVEMNIII